MAEVDFTKDIDRMVKNDLAGRGISDPSVLAAMRRVPRHLFVRPSDTSRSYSDCALPIGGGQTISQPYIVAVMTELLEPKDTDVMLEVGTGSGYQTAVLAEMVAHIHTIERVPELADSARPRLRELGYTNITFHEGDGTLGLPEFAPFDGIVVTAAPETVPDPLVEQLAEGRNLVIPVGPPHSQTMVVVTRTRAGPVRRELFGCSFVPLVGAHGVQES